jgi:hypothetical protein
LKTVNQAPKHLFFAGVLIAFYVLSITFIAPKFGIGNAVFFVLLGQLVSAAAIDHFALFGRCAKFSEPSSCQWHCRYGAWCLDYTAGVRPCNLSTVSDHIMRS